MYTLKTKLALSFFCLGLVLACQPEARLAPAPSPTGRSPASGEPLPGPTPTQTPTPTPQATVTIAGDFDGRPPATPGPTPTPIPAPPQPERPANLAQGLLAHFPFENTLESVNNPIYSDKKYPGNLYQSGIQYFDGIRGSSARFSPNLIDLVSRVVPQGEISAKLTSGFTFSLWTRVFPDYIEEGGLILCGQSTPVPFALYWTPGGAEMIFNYSKPQELYLNRSQKARADIQNNQWQHWVVTYDKQTLRIYFNGKLDLSQDYINTIEQMSSAPMSIGYCPSFINNRFKLPYYFAGDMDELRIYNRALAPEEVKQLYEFK